MYNLDINFLRDRGLQESTDITDSLVQKKEPSIVDKLPIAAGVLIALIAPAITFGHLQSVNAKTASIEQDIKQIESEIADLGNQNKKIERYPLNIKKVIEVRISPTIDYQVPSGLFISPFMSNFWHQKFVFNLKHLNFTEIWTFTINKIPT